MNAYPPGFRILGWPGKASVNFQGGNMSINANAKPSPTRRYFVRAIIRNN